MMPLELIEPQIVKSPMRVENQLAVSHGFRAAVSQDPSL
jgi:hypothetical protein